jgi:hypothetical protein
MRQEAVVYRQTEAQVSDGGGLFYRCTRAGRGPPARGMGKSSFFSSAMVNQPCVQKVGKQPPDDSVLLFFLRQQMSTTVVLILSRLSYVENYLRYRTGAVDA